MPAPDLSAFKYEKKEVDVEPKIVKKRSAKETEPVYSESVAKRPKNWSGPLAPLLEPDLKIVFVGFNPGVESGRTGHYYAHHSNRFWKFLFWSGITPTLHTPADDVKMPQLYRVGFTDLVARCTKGITQLSKAEMADGADSLDKRIAEYKPKAVCLVGKGIWEAIAGAKKWDKKQFRYGLDPNHKFGNDSSLLYCLPSTSGLNSMPMEKQLLGWKEVVKDVLESDP